MQTSLTNPRLASTVSVLTSTLAGGAIATLASTAAWLSHPPLAHAQVNNADLSCYLHTTSGQQFDLSALCAGFDGPQNVVLQTGDVQITLRWRGEADLDLIVQEPSGEAVSFFNAQTSSNGQLDVDANRDCKERMANPVENIFWPTGSGVPGNYTATVLYFKDCGETAPIDFTVDILAQGQVQSHTGTVSAPGDLSPFSFVVPSAAASTTNSPPAATPDPSAAAAASAAEAASTAEMPVVEPDGTSLPPLPN
ncbi:MAG: hypothetical protein AAFQ74_10215 [Cyanobacteria bacterium J06623_4]